MPVLHVNNLKKSFRDPDGNESRIVDVAAFTLEPGAQVGLRGASGSGKTTFLNLIAGILQADTGEVEIAGERMTGRREPVRDQLRARHIGYVFQTFNLLHGYTALENVMLGMLFGKGSDRAYAAHLLERVGLSDRMNYRPRALSVGQQQRVAVARALANRPALVLADEPTGNLDVHHAAASLQLIREICAENNAALLLVSHDPALLAQFETHQDFAEINEAAVAAPLTGAGV